MTRRPSLACRLLTWHVLVTATACALLVAGTLTAAAWVLRARQDADLGELSRAMCAGIWHELAEPYPANDVASAARDYFDETRIEGVRLELRRRDGSLVAASGPPIEPAGASYPTGPSAACSPLPPDPATARGRRTCLRACDDEHFLRVAAPDALSDPGLRRAALVLLLALPLAVGLGALIGMAAIRRQLGPLGALARAADTVEPGARMALGVGADLRELHRLERAFDALLARLGRVVANALDNARKYAGADSRVRVRAAENDGFGVATFEDAGPGIDPEARTLVFEPFFRGRAVRHVVPRTGLGLAVVQAVVRRHGGRVSASPSELGGVALRVEIPLVSCRSVDVQDRGVE